MGHKSKEEEKLWTLNPSQTVLLALQAIPRSSPRCMRGRPWARGEVRSPTYTDNVHEAVHSIADLEEQVLALPLG